MFAKDQINYKELRLLLSSVFLLSVYYYTNVPLDALPFVVPFVLLFFFIDFYVFRKTLSHLPQTNSQSRQCIKNIEQSLRIVVGRFLSIVLTPLFSTIYYAFLAKQHTSTHTNEIDTFTYQTSSNAKDMFWAIAVAQIPTLPLIHLFVETEVNAAVAWAVTVLTGWSVIHYFAQINATKFNPICLRNSVLYYRYGLSWKATIPIAQIREARCLTFKDEIDPIHHFLSPLGSKKNVVLEFEKPIVFVGQLGLFKRKQTAIISLDNPTQFLEALNVQRNTISKQNA